MRSLFNSALSPLFQPLSSLKGLTAEEQIQVGKNLKQGLAPLHEVKQHKKTATIAKNGGTSIIPSKNGGVDRIVGGSEATAFARPWMVSLQGEYSGFFYHFCGGSLIAPNVVSRLLVFFFGGGYRSGVFSGVSCSLLLGTVWCLQ
jgi:hypothetical protein